MILTLFFSIKIENYTLSTGNMQSNDRLKSLGDDKQQAIEQNEHSAS